MAGMRSSVLVNHLCAIVARMPEWGNKRTVPIVVQLGRCLSVSMGIGSFCLGKTMDHSEDDPLQCRERPTELKKVFAAFIDSLPRI